MIVIKNKCAIELWLNIHIVFDFYDSLRLSMSSFYGTRQTVKPRMGLCCLLKRISSKNGIQKFELKITLDAPYMYNDSGLNQVIKVGIIGLRRRRTGPLPMN